MTVKELIEKLEKVQNQEIEVILRIREEYEGGIVENHIDIERTFVDEVKENDKSIELNFSIEGSF
jgi:riboflavin synthase alpha subunit